MKLQIFVGLCLLVFCCEGVQFTRCKLASQLLSTNLIEKTFLGNWVCLIENVSKRDTAAYTVTPGGRKLYGLYQIPSKWCREGKKGGECNVACESLLDDDIRDDTECAQLIFHREGFKYWNLWSIRCKNNNDMITREIYKCPSLSFGGLSPEINKYRIARRRFARRAPMQSNLYDYYKINWLR